MAREAGEERCTCRGVRVMGGGSVHPLECTAQRNGGLCSGMERSAAGRSTEQRALRSTAVRRGPGPCCARHRRASPSAISRYAPRRPALPLFARSPFPPKPSKFCPPSVVNLVARAFAPYACRPAPLSLPLHLLQIVQPPVHPPSCGSHALGNNSRVGVCRYRRGFSRSTSAQKILFFCVGEGRGGRADGPFSRKNFFLGCTRGWYSVGGIRSKATVLGDCWVAGTLQRKGTCG